MSTAAVTTRATEGGIRGASVEFPAGVYLNDWREGARLASKAIGRELRTRGLVGIGYHVHVDYVGTSETEGRRMHNFTEATR